jgi:hypothetical protein
MRMPPKKSIKLKIYIDDISYSKWSLTDNETNKDVPIEFSTTLQYIDPTMQKLFCKDVLELCCENFFPRVDFVHSHVRTCDYIAGILILEGNKTFGCSQRKIKVQNDLNDWEINENHEPVKPVGAEIRFEKFGRQDSRNLWRLE